MSEYDGIGASVVIDVFGYPFKGVVVDRDGDMWIVSVPALQGTMVCFTTDEMKAYLSK